jgi:hypothetical protein
MLRMGPPVAPWDGPLLRLALPTTTTKTASNLLIGYSVTAAPKCISYTQCAPWVGIGGGRGLFALLTSKERRTVSTLILIRTAIPPRPGRQRGHYVLTIPKEAVCASCGVLSSVAAERTAPREKCRESPSILLGFPCIKGGSVRTSLSVTQPRQGTVGVRLSQEWLRKLPAGL